jgi:hypothetical protein
MNKRYSTTIATLAIVTIMAIGTIAPLLGQTLQTASAQRPSAFTKIVRDDQAGNAVGWNPDGVVRTFSIAEPELGEDDTVLINTHQQNYVVCSVDFKIVGAAFEVNCIQTNPSGQMPVFGGGPANGAILTYTVISARLVPTTVPPADVLEQAQNATAERREGAAEGEEAAE